MMTMAITTTIKTVAQKKQTTALTRSFLCAMCSTYYFLWWQWQLQQQSRLPHRRNKLQRWAEVFSALCVPLTIFYDDNGNYNNNQDCRTEETNYSAEQKFSLHYVFHLLFSEMTIAITTTIKTAAQRKQTTVLTRSFLCTMSSTYYFPWWQWQLQQQSRLWRRRNKLQRWPEVFSALCLPLTIFRDDNCNDNNNQDCSTEETNYSADQKFSLR